MKNTNIKYIIIILLLALNVSVEARNQRDTLGVGWRASFVENLGQWEDQVRYRSQMNGVTLFMEQDRFTLVVEHPHNPNLHHHPGMHQHEDRYRMHAYQVVFVDAKTDTLQGEAMMSDWDNYFIGKDRSRWRSGVRKYRQIDYKGIYDGIDLVVYSASNAMKYDFVVAAGADPSQIRMRYEGTEGCRMKDGNIVVRTSVMDIVEMKPYVYQMIDGIETPVEASYVLKDNEVTFRLGDYDSSRELVIDPYLYFSTYTGSTADNWGTTACYDQEKNTYTSGVVFSTGYPISLGAYDSTFNGNSDVGIFVFDPLGTQRIYATYLGGSHAEMPHTMYVNDLNELVIFGTTGSSNFPVTPNAFDTSFNGGTAIQYESNAINYPNGSDIFVCRFSSDGSQLAASTYVGGSGNDGLNYENYYNNNFNLTMLGNDSLYYNYGDGARGELITDDNANVYVGSTTHSTDFPVTQGAFRTTASGGQDGIVFKIDYNLQNMLWSGYLGGNGDDAVYSIDVDDQYNLLVCGGTTSHNFPTTQGAAQRSFRGGSADGFVAKISYNGNLLMACSMFGSPAYDQCYFVRTGKHNDVFLFGQTKALAGWIVRNATYSVPNAGQFIARMKPNLDTIVWSTTFGSGRNEPDISPTAFAADICDRVYAVGWGRKFCDYPLAGNPHWFDTVGTTGMSVTADAYQSTTDGQDFYIFSMDNNATQQLYGSFFGEYHTGSNMSGHDHVDGGTSRFDRCATLYQSVCASCGGSSGFPSTPHAWSSTNNASNCNNAVFRFNVSSDFPVADFPQHASICANSDSITIFPFTGRADSVRWYYGDGATDQGRASDFAGMHHYSHPGIYTVQLIAYMADGCKATDTLTKQLLVMGDTCYRLDTLKTCTGSPIQIGLSPSLHTSYLWIEGDVSDPTVSNPYTSTAGEYTLLAISDAGCVDTVRQTVMYGQSQLSISGDTMSCSSPITISANALSSNVIYQWSHHRDMSDTVATSRNMVVELDTTTTFYCHIVDWVGCEGMDSITIRFYRVMDTLILENPPCPDICGGSVQVMNTGLAVPPFAYMYDGSPSNDNFKNDLCPGHHEVVFIDSNNCRVTKEFDLSEPAPPLIIGKISNIRCIHDHSGRISLTIAGRNNPYSVVWEDGSTQMVRDNLDPGFYTVTITDSKGCQFVKTYEVVDAPDSFADINVWSDNEVVFINQTTGLHADGCENCTYQWSPTSPLDNPSLQNPTATMTDTTMFVVTLTDSAGCTYTDSVRVGCIKLDCGTTSLFIPNAFTPNGDGLNDQLCFRNMWVTEFEISIFSRWGELVYESKDVDACWDGKFKGQPCMPGVYTFYCKIACEGDQDATFKGDITLIR